VTGVSKIEQAQLDVLDAILDAGGVWTGPDEECLLSLAQEIYGEDTLMGSNEYRRISLAVLRLEAAELVTVNRRYHDEAVQANVLESIATT
jgi:hypothetical protein